MEFLVSCKHRAPRFNLANAKVQVKGDAANGYYATSNEIDWFGCSKTHRQPADTIICVLADNACYEIRIKPAKE